MGQLLQKCGELQNMPDFKTLNDVPADIRSRTKILARVGDRLILAEDWFVDHRGCLHLEHAIADTGTYYDGQLVTSNFSFVDWIIFDPSEKWSLRPVAAEEID
jgi:hypothetical protein